MDHQKIYFRVLKAVSVKNISDAELVLSIENVWRAKTHYVYGSRSLFDFTCNKLNMTEELISIFNKVAKKCALIPELKLQIASGQLSISKANRICSVITPKNAEHWLKLAQGSKRALEKEVAKASPAKKLKERARLYNAGDELQVDIRFAMTLEEFKDFERSRDLLSQRLRRTATIQETMVENTRTALSKNDPLKKSCPEQKQSFAAKMTAPMPLMSQSFSVTKF